MSQMKNVADLQNEYSEISEFCHNCSEPVFITQNGRKDLAMLSIEEYNRMLGKQELYEVIQKGLDDLSNGRK